MCGWALRTSLKQSVLDYNLRIRTTLPVAHLSFHLSSLSSSQRLGTMAAVVAAAAAAAAEAAASRRVFFDELCLNQTIATLRDAVSSLWDAARAGARRNMLGNELRVWANMLAEERLH